MDLPFLNLSQCANNTLENQQSLVALMLGTTNGNTPKVGSEKSVSKGLHSLFKSRPAAFDVGATPFIAGIGYKPVKVSRRDAVTVVITNE